MGHWKHLSGLLLSSNKENFIKIKLLMKCEMIIRVGIIILNIIIQGSQSSYLWYHEFAFLCAFF